ncbi:MULTISPECIES: isocitrate lyase/phosphoenolpyruvate mutase family protein [unclassified Shewanella]|uniref:isocitrate lyase/PEP mutase family protein n=1 Tax=Shewanella TaxID=22 RepID=UPI001C5A74F7|nr:MULTISPECIES: isocitrate lyase/phosphoenolpyruvate mutase family protein [unclassified Shewanella]MBW3529848.1 isocitrate lyase/phosphoenolpyruvate mutase family protein [Shewanella sp. NKUCC06_TVS]MCU7964612.1 isocitrate lyase/phosphoenolpyruvate mutase family protein [Shewanella sp. SW32]MCU7972537.1 isocitrate lyase/phosphoenolpyruvate mutase family protein [Shewanella sp. SW29]MCU8090460.1 isocitrate lyase/phosphoenolpyruvate mutase family protein [Shewanella sp. SM20]
MAEQSRIFFKALHQQSEPLILTNAWDAASAAIIQASGARAIATSSAALAWSLGYPDGQALPKVALLDVVNNILRLSRVPVTIDIESGYSQDPYEVAAFVAQLAELGVAGINIEDGSASVAEMVAKIKAIRAHPRCQGLFINARTDVYLLGLASGEAAVVMTIDRLTQYQAAGADGGFIPGANQVETAKRLFAAVDMPLNFMLLNEQMDIGELFAAGVQRFSTGPASFLQAYSTLLNPILLNSIKAKPFQRESNDAVIAVDKDSIPKAISLGFEQMNNLFIPS